MSFILNPLLRIARLVAVAMCIAAALPAFAADEACKQPERRDDGWIPSEPGAVGMQSDFLCGILSEMASGPDNIHGILIERRGRLVAELYRKGPDRPINVFYGLFNPFGADVDFGTDTLHDTRSISKSVIGLLYGVALQQGRIGSMATPVLHFYPELDDLKTPARSAITLHHLLSMSSGLHWDEGALPNDETQLFWKSEPYSFVLGQSVDHESGKVFNYNSGGTAVLADILSRSTGKPWLELARTVLFEPLGITQWEWATDMHDRPLAFTGLRMRPRDMLKLGRLVLNHGRWNDRQLIPEQWITESLRSVMSTGFRIPPTAQDELQYGYQWWSGTTTWKSRQLRWHAAFGNGGQRIYVVPELDLAVVITAGAYGEAQINHTASRLLEQIVASVNE